MNNHVDIESSRRDLFIDMVVDKLIILNDRIMLPPCFEPSCLKQVWDYLKQG